MKKVKTLITTNACLISNGVNHQKQVRQATTVNKYEYKLDSTGYFWTYRYKVVRGQNSVTFTKRNDGNM